MRKWLFFLYIFISIVACSKREKGNIIPRRDLVPLLVDIHITDAIALNNIISGEFGGLDSSMLYQAVLDKYGYTKDELVQTLRYYSSEPEKLIEIYDDVFSTLSKESEEAKELYSSTTISRTIPIWRPNKTRYFVKGDTVQYPQFDIKIDTTGIFVLSVEIKITTKDESVNPRILAYFYNPFDDSKEKRVYFDETRLIKSGFTREYTLLKKCSDENLSRLRLIIPMHDTQDSIFVKDFDMKDLRVSLIASQKKK